MGPGFPLLPEPRIRGHNSKAKATTHKQSHNTWTNPHLWLYWAFGPILANARRMCLAWPGCRGGNRNRNARLDLAKGVWENHNSQFTIRNSQLIIHNSQVTINISQTKIQDPRSRSKNPESKRSPEGLLDEKEGFEDQLSYLEMKFGGRKWSFQCLVKTDDPKTCSYGFGGSLASIWQRPSFILLGEVNPRWKKSKDRYFSKKPAQNTSNRVDSKKGLLCSTAQAWSPLQVSSRSLPVAPPCKVVSANLEPHGSTEDGSSKQHLSWYGSFPSWGDLLVFGHRQMDAKDPLNP